jgi:hypothetical protein
MFSKKITALVAGALLVATSSAAVQAAPLAGAALMQSSGGEGEGANTATVIGISFALIAAAILIADSGNGRETPVSP